MKCREFLTLFCCQGATCSCCLSRRPGTDCFIRGCQGVEGFRRARVAGAEDGHFNIPCSPRFPSEPRESFCHVAAPVDPALNKIPIAHREDGGCGPAVARGLHQSRSARIRRIELIRAFCCPFRHTSVDHREAFGVKEGRKRCSNSDCLAAKEQLLELVKGRA